MCLPHKINTVLLPCITEEQESQGPSAAEKTQEGEKMNSSVESAEVAKQTGVCISQASPLLHQQLCLNQQHNVVIDLLSTSVTLRQQLSLLIINNNDR